MAGINTKKGLYHMDIKETARNSEVDKDKHFSQSEMEITEKGENKDLSVTAKEVPMGDSEVDREVTSDGDVDASKVEVPILQEFSPLTHLLSTIPLQAQRGLFTMDIKLTCVDAIAEFVVLGSSIGVVFMYDRRRCETRKLRCEESIVPVTCVKIIASVDFMVAAGTKDGLVFAFQVPRENNECKLEKFVIQDLHHHPVTNVEWSQNAMKLFSGDTTGQVVCTEIEYEQHVSKSRILLQENHPIVQLSYFHKILLISTTSKSVIGQFKGVDSSSFHIIQVGQKERKSQGKFGACLSPLFPQKGHAVVFASRPGLRLWKANLEGMVIETIILKDVILKPFPQIQLLGVWNDLPHEKLTEFQFGPVVVFDQKFLLTWNTNALYVIDTITKSIVAGKQSFVSIKDVATFNDEIFVLQGTRHLMRIATKPEQSLCVAESYHPSLLQGFVTPFKEISTLMKGKYIDTSESAGIGPQLTKGKSPSMSSLDIRENKHNHGSLDYTNVFSSVLGNLQKTLLKSQAKKSDNGLNNCVSVLEATAIIGEKEAETRTVDEMALEVLENESNPGPLAAELKEEILKTIYPDTTVEKEKKRTDVQGPRVEIQWPTVVPTIVVKGEGQRKVEEFSKIGEEDFEEVVYCHRVKKKHKKKKKGRSGDFVSPLFKAVTSGVDAYDLPVSRSLCGSIQDSSGYSDSERSTCSLSELETLNKFNYSVDHVDKKCEVAGAEKKKCEVPGTEEKKCEVPGTGEHHNQGECCLELGKRDNSSNNFASEESKNQFLPKAREQFTLDNDEQKESSQEKINKVQAKKCHLSPCLGDSDADEITFEKQEGNSLVQPASFESIYTQHSRCPVDQQDSELNSSFGWMDVPDAPSHLKNESDIYYQSNKSCLKTSAESSQSIEKNNAGMLDKTSKHGTSANMSENRCNCDTNWLQFKLPGSVVSLGLCDTFLCCVDNKENVYYTRFFGPSYEWVKADRPAHQVAVSPTGSILWVLYRGKVYAAKTWIRKGLSGAEWLEVAEDISFISVDENCAWYITNNCEIRTQQYLSMSRPCYKSMQIECMYVLRQVVCRKGVVWGLTSGGELIYRAGISGKNPTGTDWKKVRCESPLTVSSVTLGNDHKAWAVDDQGTIWFRDGVTSASPDGLDDKWWEVDMSDYLFQDISRTLKIKNLAVVLSPEKLSNLFLGHQRACITSSLKGVYYCAPLGTTLYFSGKKAIGHRWEKVTLAKKHESLKWIIASASGVYKDQGLIWLVLKTGELFCVSPHHDNPIPVVLPLNEQIRCLCPAPEALWILTQSRRIFIRRGISEHCIIGSGWVELDVGQLGEIQLTHICCSHESVWGCDDNGCVMMRLGTLKPPSVHNLPQAWIVIDTQTTVFQETMRKVYNGPKFFMVWAIDNKNNVFVREGVFSDLPVGTGWVNVPGIQAKQLAISEETVWALTTEGDIYRRFGISQTNFIGDYWKKIPGHLELLSVTVDDDLWGLKENGALYSHLSSSILYEERKTRTSTKELEEADWEIL
ncbi:tectonin beta-propeller repeat-containing protein 2 isoform X2 [Tachypleus tridentatus]|uniref:tectonin beta-propeller repeat-containing protein 2 isoform X2 n=1 Tax=Tachypleus tridentatus TaxID=6853 RepID=UPI003FD23323